MSVRLSVLRFTESKNYFFVSLPSPNPIQRLEPANRNTEVHCQNIQTKSRLLRKGSCLSGQDKMGGPDMSYRNFYNQTR